ncbi:unnamed protein product [Closterium sp. NIES-54]
MRCSSRPRPPLRHRYLRCLVSLLALLLVLSSRVSLPLPARVRFCTAVRQSSARVCLRIPPRLHLLLFYCRLCVYLRMPKPAPSRSFILLSPVGVLCFCCFRAAIGRHLLDSSLCVDSAHLELVCLKF